MSGWWSWGGAPGAGRAGDLTVPQPIPGLTNVVQVRSLLAHGYALQSNGDVVGWGLNGAGQAGLVAGTGPRPVLGIGGTGTMHEIVELADNGATVFALGTAFTK